MKKLFTLLFAAVLVSGSAWAQCTPDLQYTSPGLYPDSDSLACIQRTVLYDEVIQFRNFEDVSLFGQTLQVDSIQILNIYHVPTGITYTCNDPLCRYTRAENGCVNIAGTTSDPAGTYVLKFRAEVWGKLVTVLGTTPFNQTLDSTTLETAGLGYELLVIEPGTACRGVLPGSFNLSIDGSSSACQGSTVVLTVNTDATAPYTVLWSTGATTDTIHVTSPATVSVVVTDNNSVSDTATHSVGEILAPTAGFTYLVYGDSVVVTAATTGNVTTSSYDFAGEGTVSNTPNASFVFDEDGTYTITQIVANDCGSDTTTEDVTITTIGINNLGSTLSKVQVSPNPSNGNFNLKLVALENSPVSVKIFNLQGQQVYASTFNAVAGQASNQAIELSNAATGIYIIQVQANDALVTEKLIVK